MNHKYPVKTVSFEKALPVWALGRETEMKMVVANSAAKSKDKSLFVVEACGGPRYPNYDKRTPSDEEICAEAVQMIGSNAKGLMYWCYRPRLSDFDTPSL